MQLHPQEVILTQENIAEVMKWADNRPSHLDALVVQANRQGFTPNTGV